jgi:predicted patatin/cPLA2 family phospholipase
MAGGGMTASTFGAGVIDILDYADTNKFKTTRTLNGVSSNASSAIDYIFLVSGLWRSTSAITSITLTGNNFAQYSHFALYGIKGV